VLHEGLEAGVGGKNHLVNGVVLAAQEISQQADEKPVYEKAREFRFEIKVKHEDLFSFKTPLELEEERRLSGLARAN